MEEKHSAAIVELKRKFCNDIFELETDLEQKKKYEIRQLKLQEESDIEFFQNKVDSTIKKRLNKVSKKKYAVGARLCVPKRFKTKIMVPETIEVNRSGNFSKTKMIHRGILTSKKLFKDWKSQL